MTEFYAGLFRGLLLALGVVLGALTLSGCAKDVVAPAIAAAPYCSVARPIMWSAADTRQTKEQADRENAKWKALCGQKGAAGTAAATQ